MLAACCATGCGGFLQQSRQVALHDEACAKGTPTIEVGILGPGSLGVGRVLRFVDAQPLDVC